MVDDSGSDSALSRVWAKLGGALAIFGAVFAVVTFVVPVGSQLERFALAALAVAGSALLYQGVVAAGRRSLDWRFASLVVVTLGLLVGYGVVLLQDRDGEINRLRDALSLHGSGQPTASSPVGQNPAPSTGPGRTATTPPPDDLPMFDASNDATTANGTLTVRVGREGISMRYWDICCDDITFTLEGISGVQGAVLALVATDAPKTFQTCKAATDWRTAINWSELQRGSFFCVRDDGRRSLVRIDLYPNLTLSSPQTRVTGVTWAEVVERN